jgi:prepilin signal peptidase PulO-like enzyme (type II secretory pathway)
MILYVPILFFGLIAGSFMNVLVHRLDREEGILTGRSRCPKCRRQLGWLDLIPVFSFVLLKAKCRYCRKPISFLYPIVEITMAIVFLAIFHQYQDRSWLLISANMTTAFILVGLIFFDYLFFIIPDKLLVVLTILAIFINFKFNYHHIGYALINGLVLSAIFGIMYLVSRGSWIGFGDVKLSLIIGFLLDYPIGLFAIILAVWLAAATGMVLLVLKKATPKTPLPLGSFISFTSLLLIVFQYDIQKILSRYFF